MNLSSLARVSRNWGQLLDAGVPAVKSAQMAGRKASGAKLRRAMGGVADDISRGSQMGEAVEETGVFPALFVDLLKTAESAGAVPEVLAALADHYERTVELKRDFRSKILPSVLQLVAATLIIALLIFILGILPGENPFDVTGLGLVGGRGALIFLGGMAAVVVAAVLLYRLLTVTLPTARVMHELLLAVPVVGPCLRNFALARFSWAFHLTQNAGLPIGPSIEASMRSTGNGAFIAASDSVVERVMAGSELSEAMEPTGLFPEEYLELVRVGETSGTVPETLGQQGPNLEANARRSLATLATAASWLIWAAVATLIVYIIFRVMLTYVGMINDAAAGL